MTESERNFLDELSDKPFVPPLQRKGDTYYLQAIANGFSPDTAFAMAESARIQREHEEVDMSIKTKRRLLFHQRYFSDLRRERGNKLKPS